MTDLVDLAERRGQCTLLANVLLLTKQMLSLAQNSDWDAVANMEQERRALLHDCFAAPVAVEHSEIFAEALAAMLHMNEELMSLLEDAKEEARERQLGQVRTRKGVGHYLDVRKN